MPARITIGLLKPDAIARNLDEEIYHRITSIDLAIRRKRRTRLTEALIDRIYSQHIGSDFHSDFVRYLLNDEVEAFLATGPEGQDAVSSLQRIIGNMKPRYALPGTIRGDLAIDYFKNCPRAVQNLIDVAWDSSKVMLWTIEFFPEALDEVSKLLTIG